MNILHSPVHAPVLRQEVLEWLHIRPDGVYVDMTVGAGGHSQAILEKLQPPGQVIGLDHDDEILQIAQQELDRYAKPYSLHQSAFSHAGNVLKQLGIKQVHGVLWDLGVSSYQLQQARRGFSFMREGPLDMRMNPHGKGPTAADIVNTYTPVQLANIFWEYGEESHSRKIAKAIVEYRERKPIRSSLELANIIQGLAGVRGPNAIHPATKAFQALRIVVNRELEELQESLRNIIPFLAPEARLVVISFHSLEDRIVKQFFKQESSLEILTEKPILPTPEEEHQNHRSRSAKLRCSQKK